MLYKLVALTSMVAVVVRDATVKGMSLRLDPRSTFTRLTIPPSGASALVEPPGPPPNLAWQEGTPTRSLPVPSELMGLRLPSDRLERLPNR